MKRNKIIKNTGTWFLAGLLERFQRDDEKAQNVNRRCFVWENLYLIEAEDMSAAYDKAIRLGRNECRNISPSKDNAGHKGRWVFDGISELIPIYEDIQDEAELLWTEFMNISVKRAKRMARTKKEWLRLRK
ncbi:MAG: DUF4288 domain-containing protein [bacterium]